MAKALIVIDMLQGYMKDVQDSEKVVKNIVMLVEHFQKNKCKVILSVPDFNRKEQNPVMIRLWGEEFKDDPESQKVVKELASLKYDKVIKKEEYSSFYKTDLEQYCKKNNITELYFTGIFSGCCVLFTAVDAAYRHIQPYLVTDAVGGPRRKLVERNWQKDTFERFKLMIGPLVKTKNITKE